MFLHTNMVGPSTIHTVRRGMKGRANRITIRSPQVQEDYSSYFNAVDRNDRDSADYSISIRTNRYYLRIIFWILQQAIFCCYLIVKQCVKNNLWPEWKKYLSKNGGMRRFQIDLGISIINRGIEEDWASPYRAYDKPVWMNKNVVPCACKQCFFCMKK